MATTDYDFTATRNTIIRRALRKVGAISETATPSGEQLNHAVDALNEIVKHWQGSHVYLWSRRVLSVTLATGDKDYSLSTDPAVFGVDKAYLRQATNSDYELEKISWFDYQSIVDKDSTGTPSCYAIDNQPTPTLYVWPVPNSSMNGKLLYYLGIAKLKDFDSSSGSGDFPVKWQQALTYALVVDLADDYGVPVNERKHYVQMADKLFREARRGENDRSDSDFTTGAY
jgi:hypothetical protein